LYLPVVLTKDSSIAKTILGEDPKRYTASAEVDRDSNPLGDVGNTSAGGTFRYLPLWMSRARSLVERCDRISYLTLCARLCMFAALV